MNPVWAQILKDRGIRPTAVRQSLLCLLWQKAQHVVDGASLWPILRQVHPKVNRTTLWRTLRLFEQRGLIHVLESGRFSVCQQVMEASTTAPAHVVLICQRCHKVAEKPASTIQIKGLEGWRLGQWFWALCPKCFNSLKE